MQVDHIIPETLLENPDEFAKALKMFGLPETFEINSYENWMPSCGPCNNKKKAKVFEPTPLIQLQLERAKARAGFAAMQEKQGISKKKLGLALGVVLKAGQEIKLPPELMDALVEGFEEARDRLDRLEMIERGQRIIKRAPDILANGGPRAPSTKAYPKPAAAKAAKPSRPGWTEAPAKKPAAAKAPTKAAAPKARPPTITRYHEIRLTPTLTVRYGRYGWDKNIPMRRLAPRTMR